MAEIAQKNDLQHIARKTQNPRNGTYYSLRVVARPDSDGYEYARIRRERSGWNAWASDRDFDRLLNARVHGATSLEDAHERAKNGLHEWENPELYD
jgi:hypothetical protein